MKERSDRIVRVVAFAVAFSVLQVYGASAALLSEAVPGNTQQQTQQPSAMLTTRGNQSVTVNGASAKTGETIFSGQQIQTPKGVGATIQIPGIGRVDLAPDTTVSITFVKGQLTVDVISGCAIVTTERGVTGTVTAQGTTQRIDPAAGGIVDLCTGKTGSPIVGQGAAASQGAGSGPLSAGAAAAGGKGGLFGLGPAATALLLGGAGAGTVTAIALAGRNNNPSPTR
jgi:hypothetical protein